MNAWVPRVFLVVLAGAIASRGTEGKLAITSAPSRWMQIEAATGLMNLDGTLRLSFSLGESDVFRQLGLRVELEHRIETDATGQARSDWRVRGLHSSLAPSDREQLRWLPLAGTVVKFERRKILRAFSAAGSSRWLIRESAPGLHDIRSPDGRIWCYDQGCLASAQHPVVGPLRFSTQGALITRIERLDAGSGDSVLLQAMYDDNGRLLSCRIGQDGVQYLEWDTEGHLAAWRRSDGNVVRFAYHEGLLTRIDEPGKQARNLSWQRNPGFGRGDSRWPAPVHLASDGTDDYTYDLTSKGFVMEKKMREREGITTTTFNPRRHRLEQENGGLKYLVIFRPSEGATALERIEIGGEVIERYLYDVVGQLIGIQRLGEPERMLSYDESGRLMTLQERSVP